MMTAPGWWGLLRGAIDASTTPEGSLSPTRLPLSTRDRHPDAVLGQVADLPMGVRLRTLTAATRLDVSATVQQTVARAVWGSTDATWIATSGEGTGRHRIGSARTPVVDYTVQEADGGLTRLPAGRGSIPIALDPPHGPRLVELWLPHNARVTLHDVAADAPLLPAPVSAGPRWLHYGSSISHGLDADDSLSSWPMLAAGLLGAELTSFALSGNAVLDPFVADAIARTAAEVISLKVGINVVNAAALSRRSFGPALHGFVDRVREGHPTTPLVLVTAITCPMHESSPGPTVFDHGRLRAYPAHPAREGALTLQHTRELVEQVVTLRRRDDPHLHLMHGPTLLGQADADTLADGLHPNQRGLSLIAARFADSVRADPALRGAFQPDYGVGGS